MLTSDECKKMLEEKEKKKRDRKEKGKRKREDRKRDMCGKRLEVS